MTNYIVLGLFCVGLILANIFQYKNHESYVETTTKKISKLTSANDNMAKELETIKEEKAEQQKQALALSQKKLVLERELRAKNNALDKYKKQLDTIIKNSDYVEIRANSAIQLRNFEIACVTGDLEACKDFEIFKNQREATKREIFK